MRDRPNIVFLMPDQLRHDFLGCYGAGFIDTPNIDALCEEGIRYEHAYSEHPVCVPARAALLTGMNAVKAGVLDNSRWLRPDYGQCGVRTWPEILNDLGYYTLSTGKMHFYPWEARFGFQRRIIAEDKLWGFVEDDYHHFLAARGYTKREMVDVPAYHENHMALVSPIPYECTVDHWVGVQSAEWIEAYDGEAPFAMMVGFPGPHSQYDPAPEFATFDPGQMPEPAPAVEEDVAMMRSGKRARASRAGEARGSWYAVDSPNPPARETHMLHRAHYAGLVKQIDVEVGRIVAALEARGILDDTVIILSSDHGDYLGDHGMDGKGTWYEGSCHVPMIVRHPGAGPQVRDDLVTLTDVTATMLSLGGADIPANMDARPLPGLGLAGESRRDHLTGILRSGWMIFDGRWKLARYAGGSHLFDLARDPQEQDNRAADPACAEIYRRLDQRLLAEVMELMEQATFPARHLTHSSSTGFGRVGWERRYPMPWDEVSGDDS